MKINVESFKEFVNKATLNYLMPSVQLNITKDWVISKMKNEQKWFTNIKLKNDMISNLFDGDEYQFNFFEPAQDLKPFVDLIDGEEVDLQIFDSHIIMDKKIKLSFEDPSIIEVFTKDNIKFDNFELVQEFKVDDDFIPKFEKIAKIGSRFGKIYFLVENDMFHIEATDKTNEYTNSVKLKLFDTEFDKDIYLCFDFMAFVKMMKVIEENYSDFTIKIYYNDTLKMGFVYCFNTDKSEQYILSSFSE